MSAQPQPIAIMHPATITCPRCHETKPAVHFVFKREKQRATGELARQCANPCRGWLDFDPANFSVHVADGGPENDGDQAPAAQHAPHIAADQEPESEHEEEPAAPEHEEEPQPEHEEEPQPEHEEEPEPEEKEEEEARENKDAPSPPALESSSLVRKRARRVSSSSSSVGDHQDEAGPSQRRHPHKRARQSAGGEEDDDDAQLAERQDEDDKWRLVRNAAIGVTVGVVITTAFEL